MIGLIAVSHNYAGNGFMWAQALRPYENGFAIPDLFAGHSTYGALADDPIERSLEEGLKETLGWEMAQLEIKRR